MGGPPPPATCYLCCAPLPLAAPSLLPPSPCCGLCPSCCPPCPLPSPAGLDEEQLDEEVEALTVEEARLTDRASGALASPQLPQVTGLHALALL